ncbi:MAG: cytochrome c3 family protein [Desulforhopalus sp.]
MKPLLKVLIIAVAALFAVGTSFAGETLQQFEDKQGRSYHADLYDGGSCDSCHENAKPTAFPPDFVCYNCHDADELIQATSRPEEEKWQNPHNNMHYGKDVPCMECHGEHQERESLCVGCHSFDYPGYKN